MAMLQCKECGQQVSDKAEKCPGCGAPVKKKGGILKLIGISIASLFVLIMCAGFMASRGDKNSSSIASAQSEPGTATPDEAPLPSAIEVSASDLVKAYEGNELKADSTYKDKVVKVTGKVGDVAKDILDNPYVTIGTGSELEIRSVQCFIEEAEIGRATELSKGETITAVGRVDGLMMNVLLKECTIAK